MGKETRLRGAPGYEAWGWDWMRRGRLRRGRGDAI